MIEQDPTATAPVAGTPADDKVIPRDTPEVDPSREQSIRKWLDRIAQAEKNLEPAFKNMTLNMDYVAEGCNPEEWDPKAQYTLPIIRRHINQAVASLYAKNPKASAKRKPRMEFTVWDGDEKTLQAAYQMAMPQIDPATGGPVLDQMTGMPAVDPQAQAIVQDFEQGRQRKQMLDKVGKTLEILFNYSINEQEPTFKEEMKQAVRRVKTCGVAYTKLGFQRLFEKRPEVEAQIRDITNQVATIEALTADVADGEVMGPDPKLEELRIAIETLQGQPEVVGREGLLFTFPRATDIIFDPKTRQLKGWVGTRWIAEKFHMTCDQIKETYKKDVKTGDFTSYRGTDDRLSREIASAVRGQSAEPELACVYEVQDRDTGTVFTIMDGYKDYLKEPAAPDVDLERFFNVFSLVFNSLEHPKKIIPPSDVQALRHPQDEYNRAREGLREQRHANRPKYAVVAGRLSDEDKKKLQNSPANAVVELNALMEGEKVENVIQRFALMPIDPAMYDVGPQFDDVLRGAGSQEAVIGGASGSSATEASIGEQARTTGMSSDVDDLDDFLTELARNAGQVMLMELSPETVKEIVGPGAVWPEMTRQDVAKELYLEIKAGSSGRPNRAMELANMERAMPWIVQFPGINPEPFGKKYLDLLDIDVEDAIVAGMPSITAQNAIAAKMAAQAAQPSTGDPRSDPNAQGGQGGSNSAKPPEQDRNVQPGYPAQTGLG